MKKILTFVFVVLLFISLLNQSCEEPFPCKSTTKYENRSLKKIKIRLYNSSGTIILPEVVIDSSTTYLISTDLIGGCSANAPTFRTNDSLIVIFDDSVEISHGSKTGIDTCNGRNLRCNNSYIKKIINDNYIEYTYTFTEEDYEFAKNR